MEPETEEMEAAALAVPVLTVLGKALASLTAKSALRRAFAALIPIVGTSSEKILRFQNELSARIGLIDVLTAYGESGSDLSRNAVQLAQNKLIEVTDGFEKLEKRAEGALTPVNILKRLKKLISMIDAVMPILNAGLAGLRVNEQQTPALSVSRLLQVATLLGQSSDAIITVDVDMREYGESIQSKPGDKTEVALALQRSIRKPGHYVLVAVNKDGKMMLQQHIKDISLITHSWVDDGDERSRQVAWFYSPPEEREAPETEEVDGVMVTPDCALEVPNLIPDQPTGWYAIRLTTSADPIEDENTTKELDNVQLGDELRITDKERSAVPADTVKQDKLAVFEYALRICAAESAEDVPYSQLSEDKLMLALTAPTMTCTRVKAAM